MPKRVPIEVFFIGKTELNNAEVTRWLEHIGADKYSPGFVEKTDSELLVELAGRRCYMAFQPGLNPNVTKIRTDIADYIDNILQSGHGSVLEHVTWNFAIEGVSRVFTGEMNRHRAGWAISEGSMRYIRFDNIPYWVPRSILPNERDDAKTVSKKQQTQEVFHEVYKYIEKQYEELQSIWKEELSPDSRFKEKKQITSMMRRIVPMGVATGGIWSGNLRAIRHVLTLRTSEAAEEEICFVFTNILKQIRDMEPNIFGDFHLTEGGFWAPKYVKV